MKVFVLDDHPVAREGIRSILAGATTIHIVGECGDVEETLCMVEETRPDVVVLGLNTTTQFDGGEVCRELKALHVSPLVLVISGCDQPEDAVACLMAGADSFLHKTYAAHEIYEAVRNTFVGKGPWLPSWNAGEQSSRLIARSEELELTPRERQVLGLLLHRYSNSEIAESLQLCLQTVKNHVSNVLKKFGLESRKEIFSEIPVSRKRFQFPERDSSFQKEMVQAVSGGEHRS